MAIHEVLQTGHGATLDVLTDDALGLRIAVNRLGAEMISLARRDSAGRWQGFLHRDGQDGPPASGWGNHATVMGYYLHRLWKEQSAYRGKIIRGGNHGFLRHFAFDPPEARDGTLIYRVPIERIPPEAYPLEVSLELSYSLDSAGVTVRFAFTNTEDVPAHLSFGLHPGFAVSSPKTCRVLFPAGTYLRYWAPGNFLDGRVEKIPFAGGDMPFDRNKLPDSYLLGLDGLTERIFHIEDETSGKRMTLDFSEVPFATIWSDLSPFICLEPCWGLPDSNPPLPFEKKAGIQIVPPKQMLMRHFTMIPSFLSQ